MNYIDLCKAIPRQRQLKTLRESSLEELKNKLGDDKTAEQVYKSLQKSISGYLIIQREKPASEDTHEGWTYVFAVGLPLHLDRPEDWYSTSNIAWIDWDKRRFGTKNSLYSFEMVEVK